LALLFGRRGNSFSELSPLSKHGRSTRYVTIREIHGLSGAAVFNPKLKLSIAGEDFEYCHRCESDIGMLCELT
jgi:hypothetical protein